MIELHSLTINDKNEGLTLDDLEKVGRENDISDCKALIDQVVYAVGNFDKYVTKAGVDEKMISAIKVDLCYISS